jgi:hypothetical protein
VQPHQITMRRDSRHAIATDAEGHPLNVNDNMKEIDGEVIVFASPFHAGANGFRYRGGKGASFIFTSLPSPSFIIEKSWRMVVYS